MARDLNPIFVELTKRLKQWQDAKTDAELGRIVQKWIGRQPAGNALLIEMQCPGAVDIREHHEWKAAGRTVNHGEKAIKILKKGDRQVGAAQARQYFDIINVFDVSQTHPTE